MGANRDILAELRHIRTDIEAICKHLELNTQLVGWLAEQAFQEQQGKIPPLSLNHTKNTNPTQS